MNAILQAKAEAFTALHVPASPLILYNVWDAGSAKVVAQAGASAIATSSWSVAAAHGYNDGQDLPLQVLLPMLVRMVGATDLPLSVDFEGGYESSAAGVARNIEAILECGAIGINFEDQIIGGSGLYSTADQCLRIAEIRMAVKASCPSFFINARTDLFLRAAKGADVDGLVDEALARAAAYGTAGASGFFVPGLSDERAIERLCKACELPVNVMANLSSPRPELFARLGVSRISYGPSSYRALMINLNDAAKGVLRPLA